MPYVPNPTNAAEPLDSEAAGTAAAEFRALKGRVNTLAGTLASNARNKIINGKMEIAQRGTSFAAIGDGVYSLDRWVYSLAGTTAAATVSQQADAPSNNEFQNSLRYTVTTADTSIAAGDVALLNQKIEGFNARDLIGKAFTLSFWVRSSKTGTHCIALRNSTNDRSYIAEYTVSAANTWEQKAVTVPGGLITAGSWNWSNGIGLQVAWTLAAGTTYQTTAGAWQTGNFLATANQVNCLDSNTNIFAITGVQLGDGSVATPFEHRPIGAELALCQRYFEKSYLLADAPGTIGGNRSFRASTQAASNYMSVNSQFAVRKRAAPTIVTYNPSTGTTGQFVADSTNIAVTSLADEAGLVVYANNVAVVANQFFNGHWTASAEL